MGSLSQILINALGCEFDDRIPFCFAMLVLGFDIAAFQVFRQIKRYYFSEKASSSSSQTERYLSFSKVSNAVSGSSQNTNS